MKTRASVYGLVIHEDRILLTKLADYCYRPGHWSLPGGGMKHGELPEETLVREFHEETGLKARNAELFHVHSFSENERGPFMGVQIIYRVKAEGEPTVLEVGGSTAAVAWVPLTELRDLKRVPGLDLVLSKLRPLGVADEDPTSHFDVGSYGFLVRDGPARERVADPCQKKLCFTSTSVAPLAKILYELSHRDDCWFVKLDAHPRTNGMVRGRCFLTNPEAVARVWLEYKGTTEVFCTVQDDEFTRGFRPPV